MNTKVLVDTCVDLNEELFCQFNTVATRIPFTVTIDNKEYVDIGDEVTGHLKKIGFLAKTIKTACPSPGDFIDAIGDATHAFIVTISSQLSGSHQSAMSAKDELSGKCDVHVIDSESACSGETLVYYKLQELLAENLNYQAIVEKLTQYVTELRTLFVLNSLDTLVANGRVKPIEGFAIKKLKICPIMGEDGHGRIELKALSRGKSKAFAKLIDMIGETQKDLKECVLGISHVNAIEKALELKASIEARYKFKDILIFEASGLSSVYASDGGIIIAY